MKKLILPFRSYFEKAPKKDPIIFTWTILVGITFIMCNDISNHTQHTSCDNFIVWLLVSTSYGLKMTYIRGRN